MKNKVLRSLILIGACVVASSFAGCSKDEEIVNATTEIGDIKGESVDAGVVSALCPDGWMSVSVLDADASQPDTYADNQLCFIKGGSSKNDYQTNAYIDIVYYDADQEIMQIEPKEWYDDVETLSSFTTGSYTWSGYSAKSLGVPFVYVYAKDDTYTIEAWLYPRSDSENSASITDTDVLAILQSISF